MGVGSCCPHDFRFLTGFFSEDESVVDVGVRRPLADGVDSRESDELAGDAAHGVEGRLRAFSEDGEAMCCTGSRSFTRGKSLTDEKGLG